MTPRLRTASAFAPLLALLVAATFFFPERASDERNYLELARNLTQGEFTGLGWRPASPYASPDPASPDLWFGPGLPAVLAPLVALDLPLAAIRLTGPLFLFLAAVVFFLLLRLYVDRRAALLGAYALGAYAPFFLLISNLHSEPLAILLIVSMLYLTGRYLGTGRLGYGLAAAGAAAGVALTRVAFGWVLTAMLLAFAVAWLVTRRRAFGRIALVYGLALALCVPWLAYTQTVTGRFFQWGNSGSLSLYWMSSPHPQDLGDWRGGAYEIVVSDPRLVHHRPFFRELARLDPVEQNRRLERRALENIRRHPAKFARNVAANVSRLIFGMPFSGKPETLNTHLYLIPNSLLLWATLACAVAALRRRAAFPVEGVAFLAFGLFGFALHAVLASYPRMLMPLIPIAIWFVVVVARQGLPATPPAPAPRPRRQAVRDAPRRV